VISAFNKISGYASLLCGLLLFLGHLINLTGSPEYGTVWGSSLIFLAHILIVFAFIGLYEGQGSSRNLISMIGMITGVLGTIISACVIFTEIAGASGINVSPIYEAPVSQSIYTYGPLLFVVGMILFGLSSMIKKNPTLIGGLLLILGMLVFGMGSISGHYQLILEVIGAAITGLGFIWCGIKLLQKGDLHQTNSVNIGR
jgi:hypothetical protein